MSLLHLILDINSWHNKSKNAIICRFTFAKPIDANLQIDLEFWSHAGPIFKCYLLCSICHTGALQQRVAVLEQERAELIRVKEKMEAEFNHKRAKIKELYLSKEGET